MAAHFVDFGQVNLHAHVNGLHVLSINSVQLSFKLLFSLVLRNLDIINYCGN